MEYDGGQSEMPLAPAEALQIVSAFFDTEWPQTKVEGVRIQKVTGRSLNSLHLLTRSTTASEEPASVLIRHFGITLTLQEPLESSTSLSAAEQAIIYHEMGRRGWGPKVYGVFRGGRVEEYIDSHPLTAAESMDDAIRKDIARSYARLHSLRLPLRKRNFEVVVDELKKSAEKKDEVIQKVLEVACPETIEFVSLFRDTDWALELDWVSSLFKEHECPAAIALGDPDFLNVIVKNYDSDCRVMLVNYETAMYSYRGVDIGGHFNERMYCWSNPESKLTGYLAPDKNEQYSFCKFYHQEMRDLGLDITIHDVTEAILSESKVGWLYQLLFSILMGIVSNEIPRDRFYLSGITHMITIYRQLKHDFTKRRRRH